MAVCFVEFWTDRKGAVCGDPGQSGGYRCLDAERSQSGGVEAAIGSGRQRQRPNAGRAHHGAVDSVGAGIGDLVMLVTGSSARLTLLPQKAPTDATIVAIVDAVEVDGKIVYGGGQS